MGIYCRILEEVEAIQAKEDNLNEVIGLAGEAIKVSSGPLLDRNYYQILGFDLILKVDDWLIKHRDGRLEVMSNESFKRNYEPK